MEKPKKQKNKELASEYFEVYNNYSGTLRTWFLTIGAGVPLFTLTETTLSKALLDKKQLLLVFSLFAASLVVQIFLLFLNKAVYFYLSSGYDNESKNSFLQWKVKLAFWFSEQFWIDVILDFVSILLMLFAVYIMLTARIDPPVIT